MSAAVGASGALVAAVAERLRAHPGLSGAAVFDAPPTRAGVPFAEVGEPALADWSGVGWTGRDGVVAVTLVDEGERPVRLRRLAGEAEACLLATPPPAPEGWRLVRMRLARSRMARRGGRWTATVEFAVRMVREGDGA